jgi:hypothetical protein
VPSNSNTCAGNTIVTGEHVFGVRAEEIADRVSIKVSGRDCLLYNKGTPESRDSSYDPTIDLDRAQVFTMGEVKRIPSESLSGSLEHDAVDNEEEDGNRSTLAVLKSELFR